MGPTLFLRRLMPFCETRRQQSPALRWIQSKILWTLAERQGTNVSDPSWHKENVSFLSFFPLLSEPRWSVPSPISQGVQVNLLSTPPLPSPQSLRVLPTTNASWDCSKHQAFLRSGLTLVLGCLSICSYKVGLASESWWAFCYLGTTRSSSLGPDFFVFVSVADLVWRHKRGECAQ